MAGYKTIKDQIVAIASTVSGISVVYGKEATILGQFPAVCVSAKSHQGAFEDTVSNMKTWEHFVRLYFRLDGTNDPDYEDVLTIVADSLIEALEHNLTLNGVVDWAMPSSGVWKYGEKEVPVRYLEMSMVSKARLVR